MVRTSKGFTKRHQAILDFLGERLATGFSPTLREIAKAVDISSTSVVAYYLKQLQDWGYIERYDKFSRSIRLLNYSTNKDLVKIPILGPIAAGLPIQVSIPGEAYIGDEIDGIDVPRSLLPIEEIGSDLFALRVKGDSMVDAMINDGDIIVMKRADQANNGEIVAIWLPGRDETTLKYFYKEKDRYRLQPANPTMEPIFLPRYEPLEVKGKLLMVIRSILQDISSFPQDKPRDMNSFDIIDDADFIETGINAIRFIITNSKRPFRPLTPLVLKKEILPLLNAIETIQTILNLADGDQGVPIRIISISQYSPESVTIDGVTKAIEFIISRIDPNRRKLVELQLAGAELDNRRKRYDLLSDLMKHADKLNEKQKKKIFDAMTTVATSDLKISNVKRSTNVRKINDKQKVKYIQ